MMTNTSEPTAIRTVLWFAGVLAERHLRNAQTARTVIRIPAVELVSRCEYSISVFSSGADGITSPWHVSQCCPHPSPDFEARRKTPHKITTRFQTSVNHAYLAKPDSFFSLAILP